MTTHINFHEQFRCNGVAKPASIRMFGFVLAVVFALIGFQPLLSTPDYKVWALILAAAVLGVTLTIPRMLVPLFRLWMWIGYCLHKITNPILLGLIFYVVVVPTGLLMRALGRRPLRLEMESSAKSYWMNRDPPGPQMQMMKKQF